MQIAFLYTVKRSNRATKAKRLQEKLCKLMGKPALIIFFVLSKTRPKKCLSPIGPRRITLLVFLGFCHIRFMLHRSDLQSN